MDAAILLALGGLLLFDAPLALRVFHFEGVPASVTYIIGIMGCLFASMAFGYIVAATDPIRHVPWIQVAIIRGAMECLFGIVCIARGLVGTGEAGFGIGMGAGIVVIYSLLYPRQ